MSARARSLAEQFERANQEFAKFISELSPEEWVTVCPNEERTIAALAYHVAGGYLFQLRALQGTVDGNPLPTISKEQLDRMNAELGAERAAGDRDELLKLLDQNGKTAAEFVRGLSDEQLNRVEAYLDWVPAMSVDQGIERVLIGHINGHLASMQAVVEPNPDASVD